MPLPTLVNSVDESAPAATDVPWQRSHFAVPRADGAFLAIPTIGEAVAEAQHNALALARADVGMQGRSLERLRRQARGEILERAERFTREVLSDSQAAADPAAPLVVVGHQPALYHPGVWAKNFACGRMARELGGQVLNLVVDNDLYSDPAIDVPTGSRAAPSRTKIAFDARGRSRPWEGARVQDSGTFRTFGDRVAEAMEMWGLDPLIRDHWHLAREQFALGRGLPESLTALRHGIEAAWGHHHLELPMSRLCQSESFLWAAGHLLAQSDRFLAIHNNVLDEYRALYRIKSRNHPVPKLEARDQWREAPFWVWKAAAPQRRRVFARTRGKETALADDTGDVFATLPLNETMDACCAVEVLRDLPRKGIHFRTRALTTTLFARVFLGDTFVHGIGGAKYDEMTDRIITRFWGIGAPRYATVSASLYLPFAEPYDATAADERRIRDYLRSLDQAPQRHLAQGTDPEVDRLLAERAELVAEQHAAAARRGMSRRERRLAEPENAKRFDRLRDVTQKIATLVESQRSEARRELNEVRAMRRANEVLTNREFSFVLFPEEKIRGFLEMLSHPDHE